MEAIFKVEMFKNAFLAFIMLLGLIGVGIFLFLASEPTHTTNINYLFNSFYGLIFTIGGVYGIKRGLTDHKNLPTGKALFFIGLGSLFYSFALYIWTYYNMFLDIEVPYPAAPDIFYVSLYPLVAIGIYYFVKSFGGLITPAILRDSFLITLFSGVLIFYLMRPDISPDLSILERFFNVFYPLGDVMLVSGGLIMLRVTSSKIRPSVSFLIAALLIQAIADYLFQIRVVNETYWNGDVSDLFFMFSGLAFSIALFQIAQKGLEASTQYTNV